jgi:diguanylate cyclase (GGDEF)-like protein/PAS domain S-box-containing protein
MCAANDRNANQECPDAARKNRPTLSLSLRAILTVPSILLIILAVAVVGYISFLNGQAAVNDVARQLRSETARRIQQHLVTLLEVPHQINQFNAYAIQSGELDPNQPETMQKNFLEQVNIHPSVSSIYFGTPNGGLIGGGREGTEGSLYVTSTEGQRSGEFLKFGLNEFGNAAPVPLARVPNFDARTRPWYVGAVQRGDAAWSDIYILFTGQDMALAASRPVYDERQQLLGVVSVDIFLSQVSHYLETMNITPTGQIFIMEHSGALVATSNGESLFKDINRDGVNERAYAKDSQSALIRQSDSLLIEKYGSYANTPEDEQQIEFMLNGEKQFIQFRSVRDEYGIDWIVVVAIPESAFMERINSGNRVTFGLIGLALVLASILSVFITSRITRRISQLDQSAQAMAAGDWHYELDTGTRLAELNRLARSFNHMKDQLRQTLSNLTNEVAERKRAEQALEGEILRRRLLFEESPDGILIIAPKTARFLEFNTAAHMHLGYTREEFAKLSIPDVEVIETREETFKHIQSVIENGHADFHTIQRTKQGEHRNVHITAQIVQIEGNPVYYCIWRDITDRTRMEEELIRAKSALETTNLQLEEALKRERQLARVDDLTGINNRRHLFEAGASKLAIAKRYKQPLTVMMLDIDHFKEVNDRYGHIIGDKILIGVARIASANIRIADTLGRYGGDEFIILLPMTNAKQAYQLAERIRTSVESLRVSCGKDSVSITLSIGIAELPQPSKSETVEDLFRRADESMYEAKKAGRNQSVIYKKK